MKYIKKRMTEIEQDTPSNIPGWVSKTNASFRAWEYVEALKKEKMLYIKRHNKVTDFTTKKKYQIKGSEVAKAIQVNRSSLMNTSTYSPDFREFLDSVNTELFSAKEAKMKKSQGSPSRGSIRNSKEELVTTNKKLKRRIREIEQLKTEELVRHAFDQLPLPVKRKLGID
jgi:hypothetical protein